MFLGWQQCASVLIYLFNLLNKDNISLSSMTSRHPEPTVKPLHIHPLMIESDSKPKTLIWGQCSSNQPPVNFQVKSLNVASLQRAAAAAVLCEFSQQQWTTMMTSLHSRGGGIKTASQCPKKLYCRGSSHLASSPPASSCCGSSKLPESQRRCR